jgi:hypothetical protein
MTAFDPEAVDSKLSRPHPILAEIGTAVLGNTQAKAVVGLGVVRQPFLIRQGRRSVQRRWALHRPNSRCCPGRCSLDPPLHVRLPRCLFRGGGHALAVDRIEPAQRVAKR